MIVNLDDSSAADAQPRQKEELLNSNLPGDIRACI
jgi:hypothetical protein